MAGKQKSGESVHPVVRGLRSTVGRETTTFGFSILVTVTFGLLSTTQGRPDTLAIFLYAVGAVLSFTLLDAVLSRGFRTRMPQHDDSETLALGTSMNVLSVVAGLGAAWLLSSTVSGTEAWAIAPFLAGIVYLVIESVEVAVAERILKHQGDRSADKVSD